MELAGENPLLDTGAKASLSLLDKEKPCRCGWRGGMDEALGELLLNVWFHRVSFGLWQWEDSALGRRSMAQSLGRWGGKCDALTLLKASARSLYSLGNRLFAEVFLLHLTGMLQRQFWGQKEVRPVKDLSLSPRDRGVMLLQPWKAKDNGVLWRLEHEQADGFGMEGSGTQLEIFGDGLNATGAQRSAI